MSERERVRSARKVVTYGERLEPRVLKVSRLECVEELVKRELCRLLPLRDLSLRRLRATN